MSNNTNIVISQALMMRIKNYAERALDRKDVTVDIAMAEIRCTVDAITHRTFLYMQIRRIYKAPEKNIYTSMR